MLMNTLRVAGIIAGLLVIAGIAVWMYEVNQGRTIGFVPQQEMYQAGHPAYQYPQPQSVIIENPSCPTPPTLVVEAPPAAPCHQANSQSVTVQNTVPQAKVVVLHNNSGVAVTPVIRHFTGTRYINYQSHNTESYNTAPFRNTTARSCTSCCNLPILCRFTGGYYCPSTGRRVWYTH